MPLLINAYSTHRNPPAIDFPHQLHGRRDRTDPELMEHLNGFIGFILRGGEREMTQSLYHVMRHIERVQHHVSLEVEDEHLDDFNKWSSEANAIGFLPDSTVRDPAGAVLVDPETGEAEDGAEVPYPLDAQDRRVRNQQLLNELAIQVYPLLPPVAGHVEVVMRSAEEVARRALALLLVAIRGESLATDDELTVEDLRQKLPLGYASVSPVEREFLESLQPEQQQIINAAWRYEALFLLEWALGLADELPFPVGICDVPLVARLLFERGEQALLAHATLRPTPEILDALDLHFRLHWAARQAAQESREPPANLDGGVLSERHHALNWLIRFEDADWDDVDTPT